MAKTGLTAQQIEQLRQKLQSERQRILSRGQGHVSDAVGMEGQLAEEMDDAARNQEAGLLLQLAEHDRGVVDEIDAALARIADGSYGLSEDSGEPIGFARLQIQPWARLSAADQEQLEREQRRR